MNKEGIDLRRNMFIGIFIINILVELILIFVCLFYHLYIYDLFFLVLLFITISIFINYYKSTSSEESAYLSYLNHIKKSFNSILVRINELPRLTDKNIINVSELEDLLDIQLELKKPILYYEEAKSCTFILVLDSDLYSSVLRARDDVIASIDKFYQEVNISNLKKYKNDISDLSNTIIIKFDVFRKIVAEKEEEKLIELPKLKN